MEGVNFQGGGREGGGGGGAGVGGRRDVAPQSHNTDWSATTRGPRGSVDDDPLRAGSTGTPPSEEDTDDLWQIRAGTTNAKTPLVTPTTSPSEGYGFFTTEPGQTRFGFTSTGKYKPLSSSSSSVAKGKPNSDCDGTHVHRPKTAPGRPKSPAGRPGSVTGRSGSAPGRSPGVESGAQQQALVKPPPPAPLLFQQAAEPTAPRNEREGEVVITVQPRFGEDSSSIMEGCDVCKRLRMGTAPPEIFDDNDPLGDYQVPLVSHQELPYIYTTDGDRQSTAAFVKKAGKPRDRDDDVECRICARKLFAAFFSLGIFVDVGILIWVQVNYHSASQQPWYHYGADYAVAMALGVFCGVLAYMFVLLELFASPHIKYFYHLKNSLNMDAYFHKLRHASPRLVLKVRLYSRFDWTVRPVLETACIQKPLKKSCCKASKANNCELQTRRGISNKIVVHSEKRQLVLTRCVDVSPNFLSDVFELGILTKVKMRASVCFLDQETYQRYTELRADAEQAAKVHGNWVEFDHELKVPGFSHKIGVIRRGSALCRFLYTCCFVFTGICFISCPYRLWLNSNSNTRQHAIVKAVGL